MSKAPRFTYKELEEMKARNPHLSFEGQMESSGTKKSKYGARKVVIDNHTFDSEKEGRRYVELRYLLGAGEIQNLQLQVPYELNPGGTHSLKYYADFVYERGGQTITEDVKGYITREFKKKRKLMLQVHGIKINEK